MVEANVAKDISLKKVNSSRMKGGMSSEGIFVKSLLVIKESFLMQIAYFLELCRDNQFISTLKHSDFHDN